MRRRTAAALVVLLTGAAALLAVLVWPGGDAAEPDRPAAAPTPAATASPVTACTEAGVAALDHSDPARGKLVWADEFDGDDVDADRWTVRDDTSLSLDEALIRSANVSVADGVLRIEARADGDIDRPVTTGYLDTMGRYSRRHGRWEVRARLPLEPGASRGLWPAFWLRADATSAEIDVLEAWGTPADAAPADMERRYFWAVHEDTSHGQGALTVDGDAAAQAPLAEGFHTYAVDWVPGCLRFSLDGETTGVVDLAEHPRLAAVLEDDVNMRLNLQVGSEFWGGVDLEGGATVLPATFEVEHVRVYAPR